jgi:propionyl-CoA synthetase
VAALKTAYEVGALPKTRSGKILRNLLRKIADGEDHAIPPTIDDPETPRLLEKAGWGRGQVPNHPKR